MATSPFDLDAGIHNLVDLFRIRAAECGPRTAFRFLADGENEDCCATYAELESRARAISASLLSKGAAGERALLFYSAGLEFIAAFWGCLYAGVVAVPVFPARLRRHLPRLLAIAADSQAKFALTTTRIRTQSEDLFRRAPELQKLEWLATDDFPAADRENWRDPGADKNTLALLQYTSGSTAAPRGVMVTHGNLLHNLACLREVFQFSPASIGVSWLPHYHDMGLIGGLLQPVHAGGEMIVMPPSSFLQRPLRWLSAVTRYRATTMVAPNFAYDLCVEKIPLEQREPLNLAGVQVALCGAEPVRPDTLARFAEAFAPNGFREGSFRPAYGLAEATLIVSGRPAGGPAVTRTVLADELRRNQVRPADQDAPGGRNLAGCGGVVPGMSVLIVDPETQSPCPPDRVGEIWVCGPSVACGYWQKPEETKNTFEAHLTGGQGPYLRTGDLGFLDAGRLFVTGRLKDLIIIRGSNHYPQDLEHTIERSHRALRLASGAAFSVDADGAERLIVVQEVNDTASASNEDIVAAIRRALSESHEVHPETIVLIKARSIPRTSSGKIQRYACREAFLAGKLDAVHEWRDTEGPQNRKTNGTSRPRSGLVWDYLSTQSYSHRLAGNAKTTGNGHHDRPLGNALGASAADPIVIVGIGCRFPGASGPEEFWRLLRSGTDAITEIPGDRWDVDALYDPFPGTLAKMSTRWGGFLTGIDQFDPHFFGISPREAAAMDPQQRVLLEVVWEALETAGQPADKLAGSRTGVFVGIGGFDYTNVLLNYDEHLKTINAYVGTGNSHSIAANRISYLLDLRGPSVAIDTACSSSLVAVHLACESLRAAQVDLAIAGGVNLILSPEVTIAFSHARMMAADGRCKTFDAKADGYVRAEGAGAVILKRLSDALRDRDYIFAILRGSAVNQDGRTAGIAAPNATAQQSVIREALAQAQVSPRELTYIEAHGTGTSIGDPIEVEAIKGVLGELNPDAPPCLLGSVKANIGHLENASGMAGLAKVLLCLRHGEVPGQVHFTNLNPRISLAGTRLAIPTSVQPWPRAPRRLAGVSSFGFGGTNAHVVVEEAPARVRAKDLPVRPCHILTLSARTEGAAMSLASRFEKYLSDNPGADLQDVCFSANSGRSHFVHRFAVVAESKEELRESLAAFAAGRAEQGVGVHLGHCTRKDGERLAFVFPGNIQDSSVTLQLYEGLPVFRTTMDRCARILNSTSAEPLLAALSTRTTSDERGEAALFALQYALAEVWRSWGIEPDAVLGVGIGEYVAAVVSGVMSCEDALKLIVERARIRRLALRDGELDRILDEFEATAAAVPFRLPAAIFVSGITGKPLVEGETPGAAYWRRQVFHESQLEPGISALTDKGYDHFLEIGPPGGVPRVECFRRPGSSVTWLSSLSENRGAWRSMLEALASLYVRGVTIDWNSFDEPYGPLKFPLPTYPFERERCWEDPPSVSAGQKSAKPAHPLLGQRVNSALPMPQFLGKVGGSSHSYLNDHRVQGTVIFPAAAYLEMARAAAEELLGAGVHVVSNIALQEALTLPASGSRSLQLVASPAFGGSASFQIYSSGANTNGSHEDAVWTLHASGELRMDSAEAAAPAEGIRNLDEIRARCFRRKAAGELYPALRNAGLEYGPSFQGVTQLWVGEGEALGEVQLPSAARAVGSSGGKSEAYWIHPALLDSCLQVLGAALPESVNGTSSKRKYLPIGASSVRFFSPPDGKLFSHCVLRRAGDRGQEFLEADIHLLKEKGSACCELLGFRLKQIGAEADPEARENTADLLYEVNWITKRSETSHREQTSEPRSWVIVAGRGGVGGSLADQLRSQGANSVVVSPEDLERVGLPADCRNVVHVFGLDVDRLDGSPNAILEAQRNWLDTLKIVQRIVREAEGAPRRLWIITRGAQAVGRDASAVSLGQIPLWGLAKTIDLEHPELACTRIDLDPEESPEEIPALAEELSVPGTEREVAFRKGKRYVSRLAPRGQKISSSVLMEFPDAESFRLEISRPGNLDNLVLRGSSRTAPQAGEVEIRVNAAGLNFRDVMNAAGVYPGGPIPFGAECAGTITAVGEGVTDLQPGDEVIALASGSFGAFVLADARAVIPKPSALSFGQAATIPIAFLTAYYSLHELARLSTGERVLIHAAAGGVGLAAVQLAQQVGAEIFATAGSPEKRAYLKSMRVPHILDSRSLQFADEIMKRTGGRGVDVVLNSLPGEYISRSLSILAPYGRFVEIGKTDIYQNKPLGLFPFRNNLSYYALDLERVCRERPELVRSLLLELMAMFNRGGLKPLPHNIFRIEDAANAFRYMARRKNIGKVVFSFRGISAETRFDRSLAPRADATYLITGGHGGLGLAVARWLVERGARNLVLLSRSGASPASEELSAALEAKGAIVKTIRADVSNEADVARALNEIRESMPPLRGVIHAAGVIEDHLLLNLTADSFQRVLAPKVLGAWNLHRLTANSPLDFFVVFSSVASVLGSPGQANYAAANAFLDGLAHKRRSEGLPGLAINWGPWAEVGMAARTAKSHGVASRVMHPLATEQALAALDRLFEKNAPAQAVVMSVDWTQFARPMNGNQPPAMISDLLKERGRPAAGKATTGPRMLREELLAAPPERRHALLLDYVQNSLAQVMSLDAPELDPEESLANLGLDSLMALELQHSLEESFHTKLPIELLMGVPTLKEFVTRLLDILAKPSSAAPPEAAQAAIGVDAEPRENAPPTIEA